MGYDVYGLQPANDKGKYFRANVWSWKPLWTYVTNHCSHVLGEDCDLGFYNDGYQVDCPQAILMADILSDLIANGSAYQAEQEFNTYRSQLPMEDCTYCNSTGIRDDEVGLKLDMPNKELSFESAIVLNRTHGYCNACSGIGSVMAMDAMYGFSVDHLDLFVAFAFNSGGFSIY